MIKYKLTKKCFENQYQKRYVSYGVAAVSDKRTIEVVDDISTNKGKVIRLCKCCNSLQLDPVHLKNVAEDFII